MAINNFKNQLQHVTKLFRQMSSNPRLPECNFKPKKYLGPDLDKLKAIRTTNLSPALTTYYGSPLHIHQGHKQWLFDLNGKRYLDMFGGICTVSVGHCHSKINAAVKEQMETLGHISNVYIHPKIHEYAEKLASKMPGDLKVVYFVNSGSEANDLAILMARAYTGNFDIISLKNSYHGMSYQTMGLNANGMYKYGVPQSPGMHHAMNPDVFKGIWGGSQCRDSPVQTNRHCDCLLSQCRASEKYLEQLDELFLCSLSRGKVAGMFAESIQGVGGAVQFPKGYIKSAMELIRNNGGLFISDEVQSGFGRTGEHFWGFEMHGIIPDIVTMAKGIGNGYPLAAVVTTPQIARSLTSAAHFNTFGGNPIASAVGMTVLEIIEEENLQKNCLYVGTHLLNELSKLQSDFDIVGDVRGKGLMIGVEFVDKRGSIKPLSGAKFMQMWEHCLKLGLIVGKGGLHGNVLRIKPPMCITKEDADFTVEVIREGLKRIM